MKTLAGRFCLLVSFFFVLNHAYECWLFSAYWYKRLRDWVLLQFCWFACEAFFFNNWETVWKWKRIVVKTMRNFLLWKTPLEMFFIISHNLIKYKSTPHPNFCLFLYNICCTCKHNYIARLYACSYSFIISIYFRTQLKLKTLLFPPQRINLRILIVETFYRKNDTHHTHITPHILHTILPLITDWTAGTYNIKHYQILSFS